MIMNAGYIETLGMVVTELEGGIQIDHMIIIFLRQGEIGVGVLVLEQEKHELIRCHPNIDEKVLHVELELCLDHLVIIQEVSLLQENAQGQSLQKENIT